MHRLQTSTEKSLPVIGATSPKARSRLSHSDLFPQTAIGGRGPKARGGSLTSTCFKTEGVSGVSGFQNLRLGRRAVGEAMAMANSATMLLLRRAMATAAKPAAEVVVQKKPGTGHPKKKNVFDVARVLPGWGVGHKVAKTHWKPQTYYKLYDIKLRKDAGHGAAWGIYHEGGVEAGKLQKISGANKRCWKYVEDGPERTWESIASKKNLVVEEAKTEVSA